MVMFRVTTFCSFPAMMVSSFSIKSFSAFTSVWVAPLSMMPFFCECVFRSHNGCSSDNSKCRYYDGKDCDGCFNIHHGILEIPIYMSCEYAIICIFTPHFNILTIFHNNTIKQIYTKDLSFEMCIFSIKI
jgi:hypothetical protein